ncbi:NUDIX domain-containing protein [Lacunisphaera limnophila]|uniref:NUDIX domain-containing protein n=1 Tax=Lacunisphaera limnophila TaxID=1838286 RepID=UPI0009F5C65D|nr:NUDIX domain-containing protein [Lacunisphaera limnophila]
MKTRKDFCSFCGGRVAETYIEKEHQIRRLCLQCEKINRDNPVLVAGVIVIRDGKILLARRAEEPACGKWNYPKGHVELGETVERAAVREVTEEIGVSPELFGLLGVFSYPASPVINIAYAGTVRSELTRDAAEVSELAWFSKADIPWDSLAFEDDVEALKQICARPDFGLTVTA